MVLVVALRELLGVLVDPLLRLGPDRDVLLDRSRLVSVLHHRGRRVERPGVVPHTRRDGARAVPLVLGEVGLGQRLAERSDVDRVLGERQDEGVVDTGHLDQGHVVLGETGLLQHSQHQRALCLSGAVRDLLALEVTERLHVDTGRHAELVGRVVQGVDRVASRDDLHVGAGPLGEERRDVGHGADVDRVRAERLERLGAAADVGPLDLDAELLVEPGQLEGGLGGRVADAQHGPLRNLVRHRGADGQVRALLVAAAAGHGHYGGQNDEQQPQHGERAPLGSSEWDGGLHEHSRGYID